MSNIHHLKQHHEQIWFDKQWLSESPLSCFDPEFWQQHNKVVGSAQGRGTTWFVRLHRGDGALRHYRRGGLLGKLVRDQYWFTGWAQTRSYQEFCLLNKLRDAGVNVPAPIAARAVRRGVFYSADILVEKIADARDLVAVLQAAPLAEESYQRIGACIRAMHDQQVNHTDLNIHNILLDAQHRIWLIDFDKCRVQPGEHWKAANLERLLRSFRKEQQRFAIQWQESQWASLLKGYQKA